MIASHGFEISFPTELSTQRTHPFLAIKPGNETQTFFGISRSDLSLFRYFKDLEERSK